MAKDSTGESGGGKPGAPRRPLTIDLPSEEVRDGKTGAAAKPTGPGGGAPADKPKGEDKAGPADEAGAMPKPGETPNTAAEPQGGSAASPERPTASAAKTSDPTKSDAAKPDSAKPDTPKKQDAPRPAGGQGAAQPAAARRQPILPLVAASLIGGAVVAVVVVGLMLAGVFVTPEEEEPDFAGEIAALRDEVAELRTAAFAAPPDDLTPLRDQLAALEQSVAELSDGPASGPTFDDALGAVQERMGELEESVSQISAGTASADAGEVFTQRLNTVTGRLDSLENASPDLSGVETALGELRDRTDTLAANVDGLPAAARVDEIESALNDVRQQIDKAEALGPAVAAGALAAALDSGRPFVSELAALLSLGVDSGTLAELAPHAADGLPTLAAIRARFEEDVAAIDLAPPVAEGSGVMDRLLQGARGLVEVRPANPTEGADPAAIVTRIRAALAAGDLVKAHAEWDALPLELKDETAGWAEAVQTRIAADELVARLRAEALSRLQPEQ